MQQSTVCPLGSRALRSQTWLCKIDARRCVELFDNWIYRRNFLRRFCEAISGFAKFLSPKGKLWHYCLGCADDSSTGLFVTYQIFPFFSQKDYSSTWRLFVYWTFRALEFSNYLMNKKILFSIQLKDFSSTLLFLFNEFKRFIFYSSWWKFQCML